MEEISNIVLVIGARPQYIKASVLLLKLKDHDVLTVDTGQHYDYEMSKVFTEELKIPTLNLNIMSGSPNKQIAKMMTKIEKIFLERKPSLVLNIGDTNSTFATALTAAKLRLPLGHIEAGCRCFDFKIPEEVNRVVTDILADHLFTSSPTHSFNLSRENIHGTIHFSGELLLDVINFYLPKINKTPLVDYEYILATTHRNFNVDNPEIFKTILQAFAQSSYKVILPLHPRSKKNLQKFHLEKYIGENTIIIKPQGYLDTLNLLYNSKVVITDSGGLQREAFFLRKPCVTMRTFTEWKETVECKANFLVGTDYNKIVEMLKNPPSFPTYALNYFPYGNGNASEKIVKVLKEYE